MNWAAHKYSEIFWFRLLLLLGVGAIPIYGLLESDASEEYNFLLHRLILAAIWAGVLASSFFSHFIKTHIASITCWLMFGVHLWAIWKLDMDLYRLESVLGYVISFAALNLTYYRPTWYYLFMTSSLLLVLLMLFTGAPPLVDEYILVFLFVVLWLAFMAASSLIIFSQRKLTDMNEKLELLVNERSAEAESKARQLAQRNRELEQFAFIASHDLKTPLRSIASFSQLIQRRLKIQGDEETVEYFQFIMDAAHKMNTLISNILAYSKYGHQEFQRTPLNVRDLLEECCLLLQPMFESRNANVEFFLETEEIAGDPIQLRQLFQNLMDNAFKFNESPSANLTVRVADRPMSWLFSFRDNGIGIPREYQDKVFRIFQRLHSDREFSGTGIGLALCKRIVENHGGEIWIDSIAGSGVTVYFTLAKEAVARERYLIPATTGN